ncbi:MtnX-like HAD-IB family phosphatase [Chloroflexota bacterium]
MSSTEAVKTLIQCDFDGTITEDDVSFLLLDIFANGDWRQLLTEYREDKISVGDFNRKAFTMIKADRQTLSESARNSTKIRAGFHELLDYCHRKSFRFAIVSNGLDFYIEAILGDSGIDNLEILAAQTNFSPKGIEVKYIGPDGNQIQDGFKETYTRLFLSKGYRVIYIGNGASDALPAKQAHHIFATGDLLTSCEQTNLKCTPFADLNDVVRGLELLP